MTAAPSPTVCGTPIFAAFDDARARTILVSDLHVPTGDSDVLVALQALLAHAQTEPATTRVLVLGDLLAGIVNERQLTVGRWRDLSAALRSTVDAGVPVTVLHGNRDFALGQRFARATGCRVVPGGLAVTLGGRRVLALHGDELCTNDEPYQRSKRWLRSRVVRTICRLLTERAADRVAAVARRKSNVSTGQGDPARFRPVTDAVGEAFARGYAQLVFGHVHTPGHGRFGGGAYWVLPAFDEDPVYLAHVRGGELRFGALGEPSERAYGPLEFAAPF